MPDVESLRLYVRYDVLLSADLRYLLTHIENAYNRMDCFLTGKPRVRTAKRLLITSVHTDRSIEIVLSGPSETIVGLGVLLVLVLHHALAERNTYWQGEKAKWEAKLAKKRYDDQEEQEKIRSAFRNEDPRLMKVVRNIQKLFTYAEYSTRIEFVEVDPAPENGEETLAPERPPRRIKLDDE